MFVKRIEITVLLDPWFKIFKTVHRSRGWNLSSYDAKKSLLKEKSTFLGVFLKKSAPIQFNSISSPEMEQLLVHGENKFTYENMMADLMDPVRRANEDKD